MKDRLRDALAAVGVGDFADIRFHRLWSTGVTFRHGDPRTVTSWRESAGSVRYLVPGHAWGVVGFAAGARLDRVVREARELSLALPRPSPLFLASMAVREEEGADTIPGDPRGIPLMEKRELVASLSSALHAVDRRIVDSRIRLRDEVRETWVVTSEGSVLHGIRSDVSLGALAVAEEAGAIERATGSVAGPGGWSLVRDREDLVHEVARRAVEGLHAVPVRSGRYPIVLGPMAAGMLVHRVAGHLSGGDPAGAAWDVGLRVGPPALTIGDDGSAEGLRGSAPFDAEGTPTGNTTLIRNGVVVNHLRARTGDRNAPDAAPTGNMRSADPREPPVLRLTNTYLTRGPATTDLLEGVGEGVYCGDLVSCAERGGVTRFHAGWARMIRRGELAEPVRGVSFAGQTLALLGRIELIGADFSWDHSAMQCDGGPAGLIPVSTGAPTVRLLDVAISGSAAPTAR